MLGGLIMQALGLRIRSAIVSIGRFSNLFFDILVSLVLMVCLVVFLVVFFVDVRTGGQR